MFITEIGDAASLSWLIFLVLCLLNFFRLEVIDPPITKRVCSTYYPTTMTNTTIASHYDDYECVLYCTLSFASFIALFLFLFTCVTFWVTCIYFESLLHKSLLIDNIDMIRSGRYGYKRVLETIMEEEDRQQDSVERRFVFSQHADGHGDHAGDSNHHDDSAIDIVTGQSLGKSIKSYREIAREMQEIKSKGRRDRDEYLSQAELRRSHQSSGPRFSTDNLSPHKMFRSVSQWIEHTSSAEGDTVSLDIQDVFYRRSHWLYFRFVDCCLFFQCAYLAFWCCQLMPLVHLADRTHNIGSIGLWAVVLTIPIPLNFYFASLIVNKAVLIRSVCGLNREIIGVVCDEAIAETKALSEFRERIRGKLEKGKLEPQQWKPFIQQLFNRYDKDRSSTLSKAEFRLLLEDIDIYLGHHTFSLVWGLIDIDKSDVISWDELMIILFPELKREIKLNLEIAQKIRSEIGAKNTNINIAKPTEESIRLLKLKFDVLDADKSGELDKDEFRALLASLHVTNVSERSFHVLFACIDAAQTKDEKISFTEFLELVYPQVISVCKSKSAEASNSKIRTVKSPFSHERSPLFSPHFSVSASVNHDEEDSASVRSINNHNDLAGRNVLNRQTDKPMVRAFTSPKQLPKLDQQILNILSGVNHTQPAHTADDYNVAKPADPGTDSAQDSKVKSTSPLSHVAHKVLVKPPRKSKSAARTSDDTDFTSEIHNEQPPPSTESTPTAVPTGSGGDNEAEVASAMASGVEQRGFRPVQAADPNAAARATGRSPSPGIGVSKSSSVERDRPVSPGVNVSRKRSSPSPHGIPVSDRDDLIIFPVPKGATELGLGLVEDHLEMVDEAGDDSDSVENGGARLRTVAHVRVASIRTISKSNKPHPSGLRVNDVIRAVNGHDYASYEELIGALSIRNRTTLEPYLEIELSSRGEPVEYSDNGRKEDRRAAKNRLLLKAVKKMSWVL